MTEENDRELAKKVLRDTLRGNGKAADKVRAAQLLLEHDAAGTPEDQALLAASDEELLSIARSPVMGPKEDPPATATGATPTPSNRKRKATSAAPEPEPWE